MPCCAFCNGRILLRKTAEGGTHYRLPLGGELPPEWIAGRHIHNVLMPTSERIQAVEMAKDMTAGKCVPPATDEWCSIDLRASYNYLSTDEYKAAGKAAQILYWDSHSRYCPCCGTPTKQQTDIMKKCPRCGYEMYPPISPAIIVLIRRGEDEILMVHARNFRGSFYGLVAGFLEAGETLEQCVRREVREETGLEIRNITYFDSQPWPYPSGLMIGFVADYDSGHIKLQDNELSAGAFFSRDHLPELPQKLSIARRLIDWWRNGRKEETS